LTFCLCNVHRRDSNLLQDILCEMSKCLSSAIIIYHVSEVEFCYILYILILYGYILCVPIL
jgi:hypothetical protein